MQRMELIATVELRVAESGFKILEQQRHFSQLRQ
jgi:hypothetical protein